MTTSFSDIYTVFLGKVKDYSLLALDDTDAETIMEIYLKSSIPKFKYCVQALTYDNTKKEFTATLTDEEIEILATIMILQWLSPIVNSQELLKEKFGNRDYALFSSSSMLKELKGLRKTTTEEINELMTMYFYTN